VNPKTTHVCVTYKVCKHQKKISKCS